MQAFLVDSSISLLLLYIPGTLLLRTIRFPWQWALIAAPPISICVFCLLGETYYALGIDAIPITMVFYPLTIAILVAIASSLLLRSEIALPAILWKRIALFAVVGIGFGLFTFVRALPSSDATFQSEDIARHALQIQAFVDSRSFTSLHSSIYQADLDIAPFKGTGFYPCGWHTLCAILCQLTSSDVPTVMNATDFILSALVYPLSCLGLLVTLFSDRDIHWVAGAISCVSICAFPWNMLVFGPLFPNLCALSCLPTVMWLFIQATSSSDLKLGSRILLFIAFLFSSVGMAFAHPNAVFSAAVILIPYCVYLASTKKLFPNSTIITSRMQAAIVLISCVAMWIHLRYSPTFAGVASFTWPAYCSKWQSLINVLTLCFTDKFNTFSSVSFAAQPVIGLAVLIGASIITDKNSTTWLAFSYVFACLICMVCMSTEGELKHLLGGFWYTDPFRLAATAGIAAVPLATLGLGSMAEWVAEWICLKKESLPERMRSFHPFTIAMALLTFLIIIPSFSVPGICSIETAFTKARLNVKEVYSLDNPYSTRERIFVNKVKEIIPDDALVINNPLDGSLLAYGFDDLHCYYRSRMGYAEASETSESVIIRNYLKDFAADPAVQNAVKSIGADYVLILDMEGTDYSFLQWYYHPDYFDGITDINSTTPGFELVIADRNLRLYRIVE